MSNFDPQTANESSLGEPDELDSARKSAKAESADVK